MHMPRIVGATTLFFGLRRLHRSRSPSQGKRSVVFRHCLHLFPIPESRVCPQQERNLIRLMASADATPFLEKGGGFWHSVAYFEETGEVTYDSSDID